MSSYLYHAVVSLSLPPPTRDAMLWIERLHEVISARLPDYSSQKGKGFTKQNKKVLNSLNRKIFRRASPLVIGGNTMENSTNAVVNFSVYGQNKESRFC